MSDKNKKQDQQFEYLPEYTSDEVKKVSKPIAYKLEKLSEIDLLATRIPGRLL